MRPRCGASMQLIERGDILQEPLSEGSKRFKLRPSEALLESFIQYARKIKLLLAETFGLRSKTDSEEDYYFGGSYFVAQIIPPPRLIESLFRGKREIKFLLNDDNYFLSMRNMWADFRNNMASRKNFDLRKLPQLHERLVENARLAVSEYDIVAINAPWLGEAVKKKLVIPLDDHIKSAGHLVARLPSFGLVDGVLARQAVRHSDLLHDRIARRALAICLKRTRCDYPTTFEKTIAAAKHFHVPAKGRYGIAWNGGRGMPIASTFMFLMGCCGESILRIPKTSLAMGVDEAQGEQLRPQISPRRACGCSTTSTGSGKFRRPTFSTWTGIGERRLSFRARRRWPIAGRFAPRDSRPTSDRRLSARVRYLPQPRGPGGVSNNPIGGFLLCIPTNLPADRVELAFEAIAWMTSPEAMKANVQNGFPVAPRFSVVRRPRGCGDVADRQRRRSGSRSRTCSKAGRARRCPNI